MAKQPICLVCQKPMQRGFMTDLGHANSVHLPRWCPGEPQESFWTRFAGADATRTQVEHGFKVVAYRCPECEALRLYAPSEPAPE